MIRHPIIQTGIPIPKDGRIKYSIYKETILNMDVGDSIEDAVGIIQAIVNQARRMGVPVTTRKASSNTRRMWRI